MERMAEMIDENADALDECFLKQKTGEAIDCMKAFPTVLETTQKLMLSAGSNARKRLERVEEAVIQSRHCLLSVGSPCFSCPEEVIYDRLNKNKCVILLELQAISPATEEEQTQLEEIKKFLLESAELIESMHSLKIRLQKNEADI